VPVGRAPGIIELRTLPDTQVRVIGHTPPEGGEPAEALYFEAFDRSGRVVEYGRGDGGKPLALGGAARAWLATKVRYRDNAMTYAYCAAEAEEGWLVDPSGGDLPVWMPWRPVWMPWRPVWMPWRPGVALTLVESMRRLSTRSAWCASRPWASPSSGRRR
jgi:hypothetical protein